MDAPEARSGDKRGPALITKGQSTLSLTKIQKKRGRRYKKGEKVAIFSPSPPSDSHHRGSSVVPSILPGGGEGKPAAPLRRFTAAFQQSRSSRQRRFGLGGLWRPGGRQASRRPGPGRGGLGLGLGLGLVLFLLFLLLTEGGGSLVVALRAATDGCRCHGDRGRMRGDRPGPAACLPAAGPARAGRQSRPLPRPFAPPLPVRSVLTK